MSDPPTPKNELLERNGSNRNSEIDSTRFEAMVTPEQLHSASVARKRRTFTKKRSTSSAGNKVRDLTPARNALNVDDDETRPKTPERRRRKSKPSQENGVHTDTPSTRSSSRHRDKEHDSFKENNLVNHFIDDILTKTDNLAEIAQSEVKNLLSLTKKGISAAAQRGRQLRKKKTKEETKRSQSAPHPFTEEELLDSFRRANLLTPDGPTQFRKYSQNSLISTVTTEDNFIPKPFRPEVQEFVRQRKKQRQLSSNKIVEILDPTTSTVISTKSVLKQHVGLKEFVFVLRTFPIGDIQKEYKLYKYEMQNECKRIKNLKNRCFLQLFLLMMFCGCGGFMFKFTEGSFENFYKCGVKRVKRDFIDLLWMKSHNLREEDWKSLARNRLRLFEEELHTAHEAGMTTYSGQRSWSFLNGIVYCLTVITTIGYGHIYPTTLTGRVLTIIYSIVGIPLFLIALTDFGKLFTRCIKFLWSFVRRLYYTGSCRRVRKTAQVQEIFKGAQYMYDIATFRRPSNVPDPEEPEGIGEDTPTTPAPSSFEIDDQFNLPISVAIFILLLYIFLGAFIYCVWEGWNFFKSFYFVFISMSTIGFGDVVPQDPICTLVSIVYLVFGLALMSMCINVVQEKLSDTFKHASAKIGATIGLSVAEEDGSIITVPPEAVELPPVHENGQHSKEETASETDMPSTETKTDK